MKQTLALDLASSILAGLRHAAQSGPVAADHCQPIHVFYSGAHLYKNDTPERLSRLALAHWQAYARGAEVLSAVLGVPSSLAATVHARVTQKLTARALEDLRIDFEDGFGVRPDPEEDAHTQRVAAAVADGMRAGKLPGRIGIRIKALNHRTGARALRTLDGFLTELLAAGARPDMLVVTLPKVDNAQQVAALAAAVTALEHALGLAAKTVRLELMLESPAGLVPDRQGDAAVRTWVAAAAGRCLGIHLGGYDYTAACGITAAHQSLRHPACIHARQTLQVLLHDTGVPVVDGATHIIPIGPHRGDDLDASQRAANDAAVWDAWRVHACHVRKAIEEGFYQGWDLHPGQLGPRYAVVYAYFAEAMATCAERLRGFVAQAAQAHRVGVAFDDAASARGLITFFLRGLACGALTEVEVLGATGMGEMELRAWAASGGPS